MSFSFERLADYFVAVAELGAADDAEKLRAIATILGFTPDKVAAKKVDTDVSTPSAPAPAVPPRVDGAAAPSTSSGVAPDLGPRTEDAPPLRYTLTKRPATRRRPDWLEHVRPLPPPPKTPATAPTAPPLFAPRWSRAILSTAISRDAATNSIDVEAIVRRRERGLPIRRIPCRVLPTLKNGVQLLVDRGPAAAPFLADQDLLVQQIGVVAGHDRVQVLRFDPSQDFIAGSGSRLRWIDYFSLTPPPSGVTVVLISDLGIAAVPHETNATLGEWLRFVDRIRARGNRLIAFVPYPPSRWPNALRHRAGLVPWDRNTSVQSVRRLLGRRSRRPETA